MRANFLHIYHKNYYKGMLISDNNKQILRFMLKLRHFLPFRDAGQHETLEMKYTRGISYSERR